MRIIKETRLHIWHKSLLVGQKKLATNHPRELLTKYFLVEKVFFIKNLFEKRLFWQIIFRCVLASLYEGLSVRRSVGWWRFRQKQENWWFWPQIMMSYIITSSYNHFIIMRTHRWPYGPCFFNPVATRVNLKWHDRKQKPEQTKMRSKRKTKEEKKKKQGP